MLERLDVPVDQVRDRVATLGEEVFGPGQRQREILNVPPMRIYRWVKSASAAPLAVTPRVAPEGRAFIAATGVIFAAAYMLPMVQRLLYGEIDKEENRSLIDIGTRERLVLAPALIMIVLIGVYPQPFLSRTEASVEALVDQIERRAVSAPAVMGASDVRFDRMPILGLDE